MIEPKAKPRIFLGWWIVAVAALATFAEVAFFNPVLGVFIPEFEREFGWSRTEISLGATVGTLLAAVIAPFFGPLIDKYGGKYFIAGGCVVMSLAMVALAFMQTEWQFFIIYALGRSVATGLISVAATVTVSKWFVRQRGFAIGVTTIGTRAGFATMPIGVQLMIDSSGWRGACYIIAAVVAVIGIVPALQWLHARPEALGLHPDGDADDFVQTEKTPAHRSEVSWSRHDAVRTRAFWLITLAISLQTFAGGSVNLHQIPYMVDQGISKGDAAAVLSLFAVFSAFGGLMEGFLDARMGARRTFILGLLGSAGGMVVLMNTSTFEMGVVFAASYGLAFGLMITSQQVVFADFFGRDSLGAIRGASLPMFLIFQASGPISGGFIFDQTGSYTIAFLIFTAGYLLACLAMFVVRRPALPATALSL